MRKLVGIFILTFALYFSVAYMTSSVPNFDSQSYRIIGSLTLNGKPIYPDPAISRYPYLPLFLYLEAITLPISLFLRLPQILIIKIVLTLFHLASIYAIYVLSKKDIPKTVLYALNPISLLIIAFHGQFDIIPIVCLLFAVIALKKKLFTRTILLLSLAVTTKTWPILFIMPFCKRIKPQYYVYLLLLPLISMLIYSLAFHTSIFSMLRVLFVYQGVGRIWGLGLLFSLISAGRMVTLGYKVIFVCVFLFLSLRQKKTQIIEELFELFLSFFIFTPGFGIQWFLWLAPFFFLSKKPYLSLLYTAIFLGISASYLSWIPQLALPAKLSISIFTYMYPIFVLYSLITRLIPKKNIF